jgi:hypothetical protein
MKEIELFNGTVLEFPDNTPDSVIDKAASRETFRAKKMVEYSNVDPTSGMSGTEKFLAGTGKAFVDIGRGARQLFSNNPELQGEIDESRRLDRPLMSTKSGLAGNIVGNIAATAPAAFIPGANTAVGATLAGSVLAGLQPVAEDESRLMNTVIGGATGLAGYGLGKGIGAGVTSAKNKVAQLATQKSQNAARDATLGAAREAGFVVPPSEVKPGLVSNLLEKWAGKASVSQAASLKNQQVTNKLARESLGLADDVPITSETLLPLKKAAWNVYEQTRNLGTLNADRQYDDILKEIASKSTKLNPVPAIDDLVSRLRQGSIDADELVTAIQTFKGNASTRLQPTNTDVAARTLGKAELKAAEALEGLLERNLSGDVLKNFKNARVTLGKVGTVERALNDSTGDVSSKALVRHLVKNKPLDDGLKTAAKFAQAFPRHVQQTVNPIPGGSPLDTALAVGTSAATGNPGWLALAAGRPLARNMALRMKPQPNYSPGLLSELMSNNPKIAQAISDPRVAQSLGLLGPSIYAGQQ